MKPVFGFGIAKEEHFSLLSANFPDVFAFLEIPGEMLDSGEYCEKLKEYPLKKHKALVVRDIVPAYLADAVPLSPLRLKAEFDCKFRTRCKIASDLGCRVISANFNLVRALRESEYRQKLLTLLRSVAGILDEFRLILMLPLYFPAGDNSGSAAEFLKLKKELLYPGFRFLLNFRFQEEGAESVLDHIVSELRFERNFWRLPYMPDPESRLSSELLEKMRPFWEDIPGRTPPFVCIEPGMAVPDQTVFNDLLRMLKEYGKNGEV